MTAILLLIVLVLVAVAPVVVLFGVLPWLTHYRFQDNLWALERDIVTSITAGSLPRTDASRLRELIAHLERNPQLLVARNVVATRLGAGKDPNPVSNVTETRRREYGDLTVLETYEQRLDRLVIAHAANSTVLGWAGSLVAATSRLASRVTGKPARIDTALRRSVTRALAWVDVERSAEVAQALR